MNSFMKLTFGTGAVALLIVAACGKSPEQRIQADKTPPTITASFGVEDVSHGWYNERQLVVDGNVITRINDHETGAVCYVASRLTKLYSYGGYASDIPTVAIHCIPEKDTKH